MNRTSALARFALFLVKVQWIDRRATSSFLMGITIQTALLTLGVWKSASAPGEALAMATRSALLTCTAIVFLAAMSNVQNEFRYGTVERVLLGKVPFSQLIGVRAAATAVVSSPAVVVPFLGAAVRFPDLFSATTALLVLQVYVFLAALCYQSTLLLCQFRNPGTAVVWLRMAVLFLGLSVVPFPGSATLALFFPTGWMLKVAAAAHGTHPASATAAATAAFVVVTAAWTAACRLGLGRRTLTAVERNLTDGTEAV
ncbi:hypothetical protein [Streptomyces sp. NPDC046805]|uniref:hypothetical protein n=1 Tax=Streptomyces sp. NPDC046805 TaxID=3155134 RepID=UPI0033C7CB5C